MPHSPVGAGRSDLRPRRRRRGFEQAAACALERLGLSSARKRELRLAVAWRQVAGEVLAAKAPARLRRGVLEVEAPDARWAETLGELLPRLAGMLAANQPGLGVRKCRVIGAGQRRAVAILPAEQREIAAVAPVPPPARQTARQAAGQADSNADSLERLRQLGERYLQRGTERQPADREPDIRTRSASSAKRRLGRR